MVKILLVASMLLLFITACNNQRHGQDTALLASNNDSLIRANIKTYVDSCWNRGDTTYLGMLSTDDFERSFNGIKVAQGRREMQSHLNVFFVAFPDLFINTTNTYVAADQVFLKWTVTGTNTGIYGEVKPTGKKIKINGMSQLHFDDQGKIFREYIFFNELELLQQLGYHLQPPVME